MDTLRYKSRFPSLNVSGVPGKPGSRIHGILDAIDERSQGGDLGCHYTGERRCDRHKNTWLLHSRGSDRTCARWHGANGQLSADACDGCERTPLSSDTLAGVRCSRRQSGTSKGALLALSAGVVYADSVPEVSRRSQPMCGGVVFEEHA